MFFPLFSTWKLDVPSQTAAECVQFATLTSRNHCKSSVEDSSVCHTMWGSFPICRNIFIFLLFVAKWKNKKWKNGGVSRTKRNSSITLSRKRAVESLTKSLLFYRVWIWTSGLSWRRTVSFRRIVRFPRAMRWNLRFLCDTKKNHFFPQESNRSYRAWIRGVAIKTFIFQIVHQR